MDGWVGGWRSFQVRKIGGTHPRGPCDGPLGHHGGCLTVVVPAKTFAKIPRSSKTTEQETNLNFEKLLNFLDSSQHVRKHDHGWDPREPRTNKQGPYESSRKQLFECLVWICAPVLLYEVVRFQVPSSKFNICTLVRRLVFIRIVLYRRVVRRRIHLWTEGQWPIQTYT